MPILRLAAALLVTAALATAHYTWIAAEGTAAPGKPLTLRLAHGHHFPEGGEQIDATAAAVTAISPSGRRTPLAFANRAVTYTPREPGLHRIVFSQDRGVYSRTPAGLKPGGRDQHPDSAQSFRSYRSSVALLLVGSPATPPAASATGTEAELLASHEGGEWELTLIAGGKPVPGALIEAFPGGAPKAIPAGKTDTSGKVRFRAPRGASQILFSSEWKSPAPAGQKFETIFYSTSLCLQP